MKTDYSNINFDNSGKLKLLIIVGTRPEIIRLAAVINKCRRYFDCILAHTGQNYDYNLNGVFFKDLKLKDPEVYTDAVGDDQSTHAVIFKSADFLKKEHMLQVLLWRKYCIKISRK